jgi:hypothetical protein
MRNNPVCIYYPPKPRQVEGLFLTVVKLVLTADTYERAGRGRLVKFFAIYALGWVAVALLRGYLVDATNLRHPGSRLCATDVGWITQVRSGHDMACVGGSILWSIATASWTASLIILDPFRMAINALANSLISTLALS